MVRAVRGFAVQAIDRGLDRVYGVEQAVDLADLQRLADRSGHARNDEPAALPAKLLLLLDERTDACAANMVDVAEIDDEWVITGGSGRLVQRVPEKIAAPKLQFPGDL